MRFISLYPINLFFSIGKKADDLTIKIWRLKSDLLQKSTARWRDLYSVTFKNAPIYIYYSQSNNSLITYKYDRIVIRNNRKDAAFLLNFKYLLPLKEIKYADTNTRTSHKALSCCLVHYKL